MLHCIISTIHGCINKYILSYLRSSLLSPRLSLTVSHKAPLNLWSRGTVQICICICTVWCCMCVTACVCAMTVCHSVCLCNDCVSHCVSVQWLMFAGRKTQKIASRTAILHPWYVIVVIVMLLLMSVVTPAAMANIILRIPIMVVLLNKLDDSKLVPTFTFHFWSQIKWLTGTSRVLST